MDCGCTKYNHYMHPVSSLGCLFRGSQEPIVKARWHYSGGEIARPCTGSHSRVGNPCARAPAVRHKKAETQPRFRLFLQSSILCEILFHACS